MTRYIFCDATRVSPSQFLDFLLGREPKSSEQKARELAEWQERTRRECAEYRAGMDQRAAMSVSDVLGEQVERELRRTIELQGDAARAARAGRASHGAAARLHHPATIAIAKEISMIDQAVGAVIEREGGYVAHPADRGGPTKFGVTEAVARAHGYTGPMQDLPREDAEAIYRRLYWLRPRFDEVEKLCPRVAAELFDTGVNMGPAVATTFLQRALTALNRNAKDYPDLMPDGRVGEQTLAALKAFLAQRGKSGETIMLRALEALQGERYLRLAEQRPANEAFLYGWLANRISE